MVASFGPYQVLEQVAVGSTGTVYRVRHVELDRIAAVKELNPLMRAVPGQLERMRSEAEILARLDNPHIVAVYDYVEEAERAWIAEEWISGSSLDGILRSVGRLTPEQSVGVIRGAMMGLAHAHDQGLVHRDIAPGNILADLAGVSMLVDFGLAAPVGQSDALGTPAYISPEAARGQAVLKPSDVYSAAAVLFALLSGRPPFPAPDAATAMRRHMEDPAPILQGAGTDLADLVRRSMDKDPAVRPPDAGAFLAELEEAARRRFGAGWLERASIAGLVAGAGTGVGLAAVGGGSEVAGAAQGAVTDTASLGTGLSTSATAAVPRKILKLSGKQLVAVAGAAAVVVAGAAIGASAIAHRGGNDPTRRTASPGKTAPGAARSPAASVKPTVEELAPSGAWSYKVVVLSSEFVGERPGHVRERDTWNFVPTCTDASCAGTIKSSKGNASGFDWDGRVLRRPPGPPAVTEGECIDVATKKTVPGSHYKQTTSYTVGPMRATSFDPSGKPTRLQGIQRVRAVYTELSKDCTGKRVVRARYRMTATSTS